jgi:hypothetical protein
MAEREYTDYHRALVAGYLYWTEARNYRSEDGSVVPVKITSPPTLLHLNLHLSHLVRKMEAGWAANAAVNAFGVPATEWEIAVVTTMIDGTHKEPLYPGSYAMVNRPCKVPLHTPVVRRKAAGAEDEGRHWVDAVNYGLTARELAEYETITARIAQIRTHCNNGITREERRELQYLDLLALHQHRIHARILRCHAAWLRRRAAVAAFARCSAPPAPAEAPAISTGRIGEW